MRKIFNLVLLITGITFLVSSCDKKNDLPLYGVGKGITLSASVAALAPPASDSNNNVLKLSWTFPAYSVDSSTVKYTIEIDSTGKNFANATQKVVSGALSRDFIAKELNSLLLARGYAFNVPVDMDVRVISSYANNNERLYSNTVKIKITPYKIPPKIALPTTLRLFIVGDATAGGWNNPVPVPSQELVRLDETTWGGVFNLIGGKAYLLLPANGDWTHKFSVPNGALAGLNTGGDFGFDLSDNFPGPAASGLYKIIVDFQSGKFAVTPYVGALPTNLFIVGDATAGGWNNPVPVPSQQFTRLNSSVFEITLPLIGGKQYLLLPVNGDWTNKFAVANGGLAGLSAGGNFGYNLSDNFPGPAASATYKISVNFITNKFVVTP